MKHEQLTEEYHKAGNEAGLLVLAIQASVSKSALVERLRASCARRAADGKQSPVTTAQIQMLETLPFPEQVSCNAIDSEIVAIVAAITGQPETERQMMKHDPLVAELLAALQRCKAAAQRGDLPPSARLELVRDYATPAITATVAELRLRAGHCRTDEVIAVAMRSTCPRCLSDSTGGLCESCQREGQL